jgi:hypothetical protein
MSSKLQILGLATVASICFETSAMSAGQLKINTTEPSSVGLPAELDGKVRILDINNFEDPSDKSTLLSDLKGLPRSGYGFRVKGNAFDPIQTFNDMVDAFEFEDIRIRFNFSAHAVLALDEWGSVDFNFFIEPRTYSPASTSMVELNSWYAKHRYHKINGLDFELMPIAGVTSMHHVCLGSLPTSDVSNSHCLLPVMNNEFTLHSKLESPQSFPSVASAAMTASNIRGGFKRVDTIEDLHRAILASGALSRDWYERYFRSSVLSKIDTVMYAVTHRISLENGESFETFPFEFAFSCKKIGAADCGIKAK